jgi:CRP/FNR family transcriptional regulator, cyclic AMP receptor protein
VAAAAALNSAPDTALPEDRLRLAGLEVLGPCAGLSASGPALLHHAALLEHFTPAEADILGEALLRVRARPGQLLMAEGDSGDWLLLVLSGTVDVTRRGPAGLSRLAVVKEGAVLGEMSMLDGAPRSASCTAIEAVEAGVLTRGAIATLIREHPVVGAKLLVEISRLLAQRLRNTSKQLNRMLQQRGP